MLRGDIELSVLDVFFWVLDIMIWNVDTDGACKTLKMSRDVIMVWFALRPPFLWFGTHPGKAP